MRTNRAHIISRKLTKHAKNAPVLRFRVCRDCNSRCSDLERWILRKTPLSFVRMMLYSGTNVDGSSRFLSYFFSESLGDWVVFNLDPIARQYRIATQLILSSQADPVLLTEQPEGRHDHTLQVFQAAIRMNSTAKDIRPSLPPDFTPRLLILEQNTVVAIAHTETEAEQVLRDALFAEQTSISKTRKRLNDAGLERHHFQWSRANWARFCAKTAIEALCLFEGGEVCLGPEFDRVRDFVIDGALLRGMEVVFDQTGPRSDSDVPAPVYLDLTVGQTAPEITTQVVPQAGLGAHVVLLYETQGCVSASVVFGGFPATILVLAGPGAHLNDFYQLIYDPDDAEFHFLRLAYESGKPVIPLPVSGDHLAQLAATYKLARCDL